MRPIRHAGSDVVYRGPTPDIGDLWCQRVRTGEIHVVYELDDRDRHQIAEGGRVELAMYHEPIPPISMVVLPAGMCEPVGPHGWKGQRLADPVTVHDLAPSLQRDDGLSLAEGRVMDALVAAVGAYAELPKQHPSERPDFVDAIHRCQDLLAVRIARREFPKGWPER